MYEINITEKMLKITVKSNFVLLVSILKYLLANNFFYMTVNQFL